MSPGLDPHNPLSFSKLELSVLISGLARSQDRLVVFVEELNPIKPAVLKKAPHFDSSHFGAFRLYPDLMVKLLILECVRQLGLPAILHYYVHPVIAVVHEANDRVVVAELFLGRKLIVRDQPDLTHKVNTRPKLYLSIVQPRLGNQIRNAVVHSTYGHRAVKQLLFLGNDVVVEVLCCLLM